MGKKMKAKNAVTKAIFLSSMADLQVLAANEEKRQEEAAKKEEELGFFESMYREEEEKMLKKATEEERRLMLGGHSFEIAVTKNSTGYEKDTEASAAHKKNVQKKKVSEDK